MQKTDLIVKSNQVIEAGYELSTSEQRLILAAIEKIPKGTLVSSKTIYEVNANDLVRLFGVHEKTAYRDLKEAAKKLYERSIVLRTRERTVKIRWLQMLETSNPYDEDLLMHWQGVLVMFSDAVTPLLSDLKSEFTRYLASDLKNIRSNYAIRFYELIKQYENIGSREIRISDLRFMLCLEDKYPLFGNLQQRVIDPAIKEINENTPMSVQYKLRKTGRKYTHIQLKFKQKQVKEPLEHKENYNLTDKQISFFANKLAHDDAFASQYAEVGEEYADLERRLNRKLRDKDFVQKIFADLQRLGFQS